MKKLSVIAPLLVLLSWGAPRADTDAIEIGLAEVTTLTHDGRSLCSFELEIPEAVSVESLLEARLEIRVDPGNVQGDANPVELQAAEWLSGEPLVPQGKAGHVCEFALVGESFLMALDITAILRDALTNDRQAITLAVGAISNDALGGGIILPIDEVAGTWGLVQIHHK